jgi:hypothetical protein
MVLKYGSKENGNGLSKGFSASLNMLASSPCFDEADEWVTVISAIMALELGPQLLMANGPLKNHLFISVELLQPIHDPEAE